MNINSESDELLITCVRKPKIMTTMGGAMSSPVLCGWALTSKLPLCLRSRNIRWRLESVANDPGWAGSRLPLLCAQRLHNYQTCSGLGPGTHCEDRTARTFPTFPLSRLPTGLRVPEAGLPCRPGAWGLGPAAGPLHSPFLPKSGQQTVLCRRPAST